MDTALGRLEEWNVLPEPVQLVLARQAMQLAIASVIGQAEQLARQIGQGALPDHGGEEALLLFASLLRVANEAADAPAGALA